MNPNPDPLEKFVNDAVRGLPPRRAPRALESRVLAEIARREALPWYRRSWAYWPTAVRGVFLVVSATLAAAMIAGCLHFLRGGSLTALAQIFEGPVRMATALGSAIAALFQIGSHLVEIIPPVWLYSGLGALALLYVTVFGLGAAAYRTLYQTR